MRTLGKVRFAALLTFSLAVVMALPTVGMAAQAPVPLGTTSSFAVLAGSTVTNTGATTINGDAGGDLGVSPGGAFTGAASVTLSGATHLADPVALGAQNDLVTAYDNAAGRTPVTRIPTELGGKVLKPGIYDSANGTFQITGTLTLDAEGDPDGVFVFLTDSTLITASNSRVSVINSARFCRVFWKVGSSATLGTYSHFVGHIFALTSITANHAASVQGQLLARNGAVTLDNNTITNGICVSAQGAAIHIAKAASPSALTTAPASVTYTYLVTNPGTLPLSTVTVTDDKVSPVTYVSGDVNTDGLLQPGETWTYTASATLRSTSTNTGIASGIGNGVTAIDTAAVTVDVAVPVIHVAKAASPSALTSGPGSVTFTYRVTNPGTVALSAVTLTDDKVSPLTYVSGDANNDNLLQPGETWTYTGTATLRSTTKNTATARGSANGLTATATAATTVRVTSPGETEETVTGGEIPKTATPWYDLLLGGVALILVGGVGYWRATRKSRA